MATPSIDLLLSQHLFYPFDRPSHTLQLRDLPGTRPNTGFAWLMDKLTLCCPLLAKQGPVPVAAALKDTCSQFAPDPTHPAHPLTSRSRSKNYWSNYLTLDLVNDFPDSDTDACFRSYTFLQCILRAPILCLHSLLIKGQGDKVTA